MWWSPDQHRADFFGLSQFTKQDGGLANRTKLTNTAKIINPRLTRQGGFSGLYFSLEIWPQKMVKS